MTPALRALAVDLADLGALLAVLAAAAEARQDEDTRRTLRLAARTAEAIVERLEAIGAEVAS